MKTTNVKADNLNYDNYETEKYDTDILRVIPGHDNLHKEIENFLKKYIKSHQIQKIADLGIGTGLTSERILKFTPDAKLIAVDFSDQMIGGAKKRLENFYVEYIFGDYSEMDLEKDFDIITSVIGIHHQNTEGKKKVFKKVFDCLKNTGVFIFGDLVTFRDKKEAATNDAKHYHHLVENAEDEKSLREWAYHHKFLNDLAPIEDQLDWLKKVGFRKVSINFQHFNTALIIAEK